MKPIYGSVIQVLMSAIIVIGLLFLRMSMTEALLVVITMNIATYVGSKI